MRGMEQRSLSGRPLSDRIGIFPIGSGQVDHRSEAERKNVGLLRSKRRFGWAARRVREKKRLGGLDGYTQMWEVYTSGRKGWKGRKMRTNIEIEDELMREAMRSSGKRTKRAAVEAGLRLLVQTRAQGKIRRLRGKIRWQGDLEASRLGRGTEESGTTSKGREKARV
jgi:Arc/MetJ family transcription regulator